MKSVISNVNCLVALLKQYSVKNVVLAPGASDIPVIHIIETDPFFTCYSVVDERSLVYFAMGVAQNINEPVACVCTSGTAVSNFLPGITEAFYQDVPIVAITCDKNQNYQGQIETQKIEQVGIFGESVKKCVNLPVITNEEEFWLCERLVNEALIAMTHHGRGPVQINIPVIGDIGSYEESEIPACKKIDYIEKEDTILLNKYTHNKIKDFKKIMVVIGQNHGLGQSDLMNLEKFAKSYNVIFAVDHLSNLSCFGAVNTYPITELEKEIDESLYPALVISVGNNIASYDLKYIMRRINSVEHWQIDPAGRIRDVFHHLSAVFECSASFFFSEIDIGNVKDNNYLKLWEAENDKIKINNLPFSSFYIANKLSRVIPENSILHLAILNSTRLMQYFDLAKGVKVYSNFGALGIDGCMSSFMGQAYTTDELAFCLIGDLSFFYDMNAVGICHRKNNIRIILINNSGAGEFYFTLGKQKISTIDTHIAATNCRIAKGWVESLGYQYYMVKDKKDVDEVFQKLNQPSDQPVFVEVFLNIENDTNVTKEVYAKYRKQSKSELIKGKIKGVIGNEPYEALKQVYHKIKR